MANKSPQLKLLLSATTVDDLAKVFSAQSAQFDAAKFKRRAKQGLTELELKARVSQIARALDAALPAEFPDAIEIVMRAVRAFPPLAPEETISLRYWPVSDYIGTFGLEHRVLAFAAMRELTEHSTCEFAVRSYIEAGPGWAFKQLKSFARDKNPHVRRLASEGSRPRLPWAPRVRLLQEDPARGIALLDLLYADPELYVRRSVANHLNDVAKDDPDLAVSTAGRWLKCRDTAEVRWLVRHALRSLVKDGHAGALRLQGFGPAKIAEARLRVTPKKLRFGDDLKIHVEFLSKDNQSLMVDFALHRKLASGASAAKVFKLKRVELAAGESWGAEKSLSIRPISTRRYYDGEHQIELLINGKSVKTASFWLSGAGKG